MKTPSTRKLLVEGALTFFAYAATVLRMQWKCSGVLAPRHQEVKQPLNQLETLNPTVHCHRDGLATLRKSRKTKAPPTDRDRRLL